MSVAGSRDQGTGNRIAEWLDPRDCPRARPSLDAMSTATRDIHAGIDSHIRRSGIPYLHPDEPTVQLDLFGSALVIAWQEAKAAFLFASEGCWSELPHLYARYGTTATAQLISKLKALEHASSALVCDSGMQATALAFDVLLEPGTHAVLMRQVYNKTRSYLEWLANRIGASVSVVDDGDGSGIAAAIRPETRLVFAETLTNPLVRAQDLDLWRNLIAEARGRAPGVRFVLDTTIASPFAFDRPPLTCGVDIIVASGTKSLGGNDRDMWGYLATNDTQFANGVMDLMAMRGGILDWRRAGAVLASFEAADDAHARRCASADRIAAFLAAHPMIGEVFHPSLPDHPDAAAIRTQYRRHGSLLSFRIKDADEERTRHYADVLATTVVVRYALSFDGLSTKVNHHRTVSEYFTAPEQLRRSGVDRLIRLAVGLEDADDIIAALNWTLHHGGAITAGEIQQWQRERIAALGIPRP